VFWAGGYADTAVQDLEKATGVNKSGLYSEFKDKEEIFLESLKFYYSSTERKILLSREPLGWKNIEDFLRYVVERSSGDQRGCFGVNSMRELDLLPEAAKELIAEDRRTLKRLFLKNIAAEKTKMAPESIAELVATYFSGFCIEQNMKLKRSSLFEKIDDLIATLRMI